MKNIWTQKTIWISAIAVTGILLHLILRFGIHTNAFTSNLPLWTTLLIGGIPLLYDLSVKVLKKEFGSDLLAGIAIITSVLLHEYLAGAIVVLMLSGGEALENYALKSASSVLALLARRMPSVAHVKQDSRLIDVELERIDIGDVLVVFPHEICPVDGEVIEGQSTMDESYLTGEPFKIRKIAGSLVISGAINGESALTIKALSRANNSRYAKIMEVMRESEQMRPKLRRLGDQLGSYYTPIAITIAIAAWYLSGDSVRFLSVLVIATPCPLLIGIPVAILGSISLCARRAIIVKSPVVLEQIEQCRTAIFDKTGTLTYGEPKLTELLIVPEFEQNYVLGLAASVERYSKHPLANAILVAARNHNAALTDVTEVSEHPGTGLYGVVSNHKVRITSRKKLAGKNIPGIEALPATAGGLECIILIDERYAGTFRFHDAPRAESRSFIAHLGPKHQFQRIMLLSGDRESEVQYLAEQVGITEVFTQKSPEEKLTIVRAETARAKTLYVGDGINDAPAMMAATVGIAMGQNSDITTEAAGVVIMDNTLHKLDEFMHISRRMRSIALQTAGIGMLLSIIGMALAAAGYLNPVQGAICQEIIDVMAVLNALRAAFPPRQIHDKLETDDWEIQKSDPAPINLAI